MTLPIELRPSLAKNIRIDSVSGCWLYQGCTDVWGYAYYQGMNGGKRFGKAHRAAYTLLVGPVPEGLVLDHICRMKHCVNPQHLRAVTPRINALENSIGPAARNIRKDRCPKCDAEYFRRPRTDRTVGVSRNCRECRRLYAIRYRQSHPDYDRAYRRSKREKNRA